MRYQSVMGKSAKGRARHSVRAVGEFITGVDSQRAVGITAFYRGVQGTARPTNQVNRVLGRVAFWIAPVLRRFFGVPKTPFVVPFPPDT